MNNMNKKCECQNTPIDYPVNCPGFSFGAVCSGIKYKDKLDLGIIFSDIPCNVAGAFTKNHVKAAPVLLCQERLEKGKCQAVIVNSGCANCCTGEQGNNDAQLMAKLAADSFGIDKSLVMVASTGVIGKLMPMKTIEIAMPSLKQSVCGNGLIKLARAIMTTDTVPKVASRKIGFDNRIITIAAIAKGAGMIRPDMATMLCFVVTDADASSHTLQQLLNEAVNSSFNVISVDGDTSTNDTVLLLANGMSNLSIDNDNELKVSFANSLNDILLTLAKEIVRDGEGATKFVTVTVKGAVSDSDAKQVADTIAHSNLVKTALFGEDANWGRIIAAAGRAGVLILPDKIDIFFDSVQMVKNGIGCGEDAEHNVTSVLKQREFTIIVDLNMGNSSFSMYTCDFSIDYVKINADYRT